MTTPRPTDPTTPERVLAEALLATRWTYPPDSVSFAAAILAASPALAAALTRGLAGSADVLALREALLANRRSTYTDWWFSDCLDTLIAAVRAETLAGAGVRTVQAKEPPSGVDSHMAGWVRWDKPMDPITRLLANLDYESYEVDAVGGGKVRCWKFSEWPDALRRAVGAVRALAATPPTPALTARIGGRDHNAEFRALTANPPAPPVCDLGGCDPLAALPQERCAECGHEARFHLDGACACEGDGIAGLCPCPKSGAEGDR